MTPTDSGGPSKPSAPQPGQSDIDPSIFDFATPPAEWLAEHRKNAMILVANAAIGSAEPTQEQRPYPPESETQ